MAAVAGSDDHSFRRRPRRQAAGDGDLLLPSAVGRTGRVAVVMDTSASMGDGDLAAAVAEAGGIIGAVCGPVDVYACDAEVAAASLNVSVAAAIELAGGGGTDMREGIAAAMSGRPRPAAVVVLTDGQTPWPATPPRIPVVVCTITNGEDGIDCTVESLERLLAASGTTPHAS